MGKSLKCYCFRLSTFVLAAGLQCYAYAGFAVNKAGSGEPAGIYESATTLVPRSVSKQQAIAFYEENKDKYRLVFAYDLNLGDAMSLDDAADNDAFCINPYTLKIGVAMRAKDAVALTQDRPEVFYAIAGETLSATIARWSKEQGYVSQWSSPDDFQILFSHVFYGSFPQCLDELLHSIAQASDSFAVKAVIMKNGVVLIKPNEYQAQPVTGIF